MNSDLPYTTAEAFDAGLADRIRAAATAGRHSINELRRQFAYDRLLVRLFDSDATPWILKGAGGLLARMPASARHSMDLDLFYEGQFEEATVLLQKAALRDVGDFFSFDISQIRGAQLTNARRLRAVAYLGNKAFEQFRIDLVIASNMTQEPDRVEPLRPVDVPGLPTSSYLVYPLVDHIADKHAAMLTRYNDGSPSTRYRDLVDLMLIADRQVIEAGPLREALLSEYRARGLDTPSRVDLPSEAWVDGYAAEVGPVEAVPERTAAEAIEKLRRFLLPVLTDNATGQWNPASRSWK